MKSANVLISIVAAGALLAATYLDHCWAGDAGAKWQQIAPLFKAPTQLENDFGTYKSPLMFDDGRRVKTPAEWQERRQEIVNFWHKMLGPWPPLLERPQLEFLPREEKRERFTLRKVRVQIAPQQHAEGYLLAPHGPGPFPAVLVPFYEPETSVGLNTNTPRAFAVRLTERGFVTLSIGSPGGDARKPELGQARCQPLSYLAYVAANCCNALANLKEVDAKRIGVVGHSYGGKWAMFASCLYEKFACGVWSDPGIVFDEGRPNVNYWEPWYLGEELGRKRKPGVVTAENPRTGAYKKLMESGHDLHELHVLMAPRPFLVSGGSEDPPERWRALNHAVAVNQLLGQTNRVAMSNRPGHNPTAESNEQLFSFFEYFLLDRK